MNQNYILWKSKINQIIPHEKRFIKALISLFIRQEKEVIKNVRKVNLSKIPKDKKEIEFKDSHVEVTLGRIVFGKAEWNKKFREELTPYFREVVKQSGQSILSDLGIGISFDIEDASVKKFIKNKVINFSGFVNKETIDGLNDAIKPILSWGGTIEQVRKRIQEVVNKRFNSSIRATAPRARMIARTEMVGSANGASLEGMKQSKGIIRYKAWLSSRDGKRVRPDHQIADRRYKRDKGIEISKLFKVGQSKLSAPGNVISGPYHQALNCRCILLGARKGGA